MKPTLPDIQTLADTRREPIHKVGVRGLHHPTVVMMPTGAQHVISKIDMAVYLPAEQKGTHMSRFVELLTLEPFVLNINNLGQLTADTARSLESSRAFISITCPLVLLKTAPVSKKQSFCDYHVEYTCSWEQKPHYTIRIQVPVTTLCPCSKKISDYGAHNQRTRVTVTLVVTHQPCLQNLIQLIEKTGSCELYGLLKRADEKYVTEYAYDNPKFVEDVVRDVSLALQEMGFSSYTIDVESLESIHNHSAYAQIIKEDIHPH